MRDTRGFTLIELLIVVAIILIITAIAIPNLMTSFIRANESHAVDRIKRYADAQHAFKRENYGRIAANRSPDGGYAADFRMLHYGVASDAAGDPRPLGLIPRDHADAFVASPLTGDAPSGIPYGEQQADQGYFYLDPVDLPDGMPAEAFFADGFAHVAVPELANNTGDHMFFIGTDGTVWRRLVEKGVPYTVSAGYPTPLTNPSGWEPY